MQSLKKFYNFKVKIVLKELVGAMCNWVMVIFINWVIVSKAKGVIYYFKNQNYTSSENNGLLIPQINTTKFLYYYANLAFKQIYCIQN